MLSYLQRFAENVKLIRVAVDGSAVRSAAINSIKKCMARKYCSVIIFNSLNYKCPTNVPRKPNVICLLPNSTRLTYPSDMTFFRPLKIAWSQMLTDWKDSGEDVSWATIQRQQFRLSSEKISHDNLAQWDSDSYAQELR